MSLLIADAYYLYSSDCTPETSLCLRDRSNETFCRLVRYE
jgi:hypothetical protein